MARDYDAEFTHGAIGSLMRQAVWQRLDTRFQAGYRVLELNCGTGEDAVYLGCQGVRVLATDLSREMVEMARAKVARAGVESMVAVERLDISRLHELNDDGFDGVLSNFGGLNCIADLPEVGRALAERLRPGAYAILCVMGPIVPWEWFWFVGHRQPGPAFRRLRPGGVQWRGLTIRYPSIRALQRDFWPGFRMRRCSALGALLPPPYTESWVTQHPRLLAGLNRWERRLETWLPLPWLADHYVLDMERI